MAMTMTDEQERGVRERCSGVMPYAWTGAASDMQLALEELDATRARVAELERELSMRSTHAEVTALLAAREAENADLRAALAELVKLIRPHGCSHSIYDPPPCQWCDAIAILSRAPGTNEALREMLTDAVRHAYLAGKCSGISGGNEDGDKNERAAIVVRLLGDATRTEGGEG